MKIHYIATVATEGIVWLDTAPCGAGSSPSGVYHGVKATSIVTEVTCKRCLKKLEDELVAAEAVPLTAEERLARIAEYIAAEGDLDNQDHQSSFISGRHSFAKAIRALLNDEH